MQMARSGNAGISACRRPQARHCHRPAEGNRKFDEQIHCLVIIKMDTSIQSCRNPSIAMSDRPLSPQPPSNAPLLPDPGSPARDGGLAALVFGVTTVLWVAIPLAVWFSGAFAPPSDMAAFGDSFGVVSSLFSALAMGGVILSLYLQRKDFTLAHAEMQASAIAQGKAAIAQEALARAEEQSQQALKELLSHQTLALRALQRETALARLRAKFDDRFRLWQNVRDACGGPAVDCLAHFADRLHYDTDAKCYTCAAPGAPSGSDTRPKPPRKPVNLPYDVLGRDYMAQFKHLIAITEDPLFAELQADEREDLHLKLRSTLSLPEKLALVHLFPPAAAIEGQAPATDITACDPFRLGLARLNVLKGLSEHAGRVREHWESYRDIVTALETDQIRDEEDPSDPSDDAASVAMTSTDR